MSDPTHPSDEMTDAELGAASGGGNTNGSIPGHSWNCNCDQCWP